MFSDYLDELESNEVAKTVPIGVPHYVGVYPSFSMPGAPGAPMMPMMSPGAAQSPRKPPPPRNALDDLNIKDFM